MPLVDYPLAETLTLAEGRTVEWEAVGDGPARTSTTSISCPPLRASGAPSLVIAGQHDFICGPAWNRPIAAAIPAARYIEIADTGHLPQYEQPGAFRSALLDWLAAT